MTFYGCTALNTVAVGESCKMIEESAFYNCKSLVSITLPEKLNFVAKNAFLSCNSLKTIEYSGTDAKRATVVIAEGNEKFKLLFRG
jgi:hypothetical protein